jgi:hypothetical protein
MKGGEAWRGYFPPDHPIAVCRIEGFDIALPERKTLPIPARTCYTEPTADNRIDLLLRPHLRNIEYAASPRTRYGWS